MFQSARRNLVVLIGFLLATLSVASIYAKPAVSADDDTKVVQQTLRDRGYSPGPIDGIPGPRTQSAIGAYQKDENLPVTGQMDAETRRRIEEARSTWDSNVLKFQGMDINTDGVITRQEYSGDDRSFANHDWNGDGVLSGEEIKPGAHRPDRRAEGDSVGGEFKSAGKEMGRGGAEAGHEMKEGKPIAAGKEFGKGAARFGKEVGEGVKAAVTTESDRGEREKKEEPETGKQPQ